MDDLFNSLREQLNAPEQPWGGAGAYPELDKYFSGQSNLSWTGNVPQALGGLGEEYNKRKDMEGQIAAEKAKVAAEAAERAAAEQKAAIKAEQEKVAWQRIPKEDGGYDFTGENGEKITAFEWARNKGVTLTDALQGSVNPKDLKLQQEYEGMQDVTSILAKDPKDRSTEEKLALENPAYDPNNPDSGEEPGYFNLNPEMKKMTVNQVMQSFLEQYPEVFGGVKMANMAQQGQQAGQQQVNLGQQQQPEEDTWESRLRNAAKYNIPGYNIYDSARTGMEEVRKNPSIGNAAKQGLFAGAKATSPVAQQLYQFLPESWRKGIWRW